MSTHTAGYRSPGEVMMSELFPNHDGARPLSVDDLAGKSVEIALDEGSMVTLSFEDGSVDVNVSHYGSFAFLSGKLACEVISVTDTILGAIFADERTQSSYYVIFEFDKSRAFVVHSDILSGPAGTGERTRFYQGGIGGADAERFEHTSELVGKRVFWKYSNTHHFEHIYLEPNRYCWHGIKGPEKGMGGVEPTSAFKIKDGLYLFSWSDTSVPFNGTIVIDLQGQVRCLGRLFGWERSEQKGWQIIVGGPGQLLNETAQPADL